eukprot:CAMPEP_0180046742 /NCGR_PEP_ID=MMETSP0984-20121128/37383_1 /TAXON_ID=483367 /ORGANISM="non described non described, Strain CCMP 2436" /LENGTH=97 /DNA_ID=CAMNT_0021975525 /DNA_START=136 /DNA_END=425 /DNA_ORIENTATION=-
MSALPTANAPPPAGAAGPAPNVGTAAGCPPPKLNAAACAPAAPPNAGAPKPGAAADGCCPSAEGHERRTPKRRGYRLRLLAERSGGASPEHVEAARR